jgi:hypothetical protein
MSRIDWIKWVIKYGNAKTRSRNLKRFFAFELYSLGCRLNGHKVDHWLEEKSLPPRKYFVIRQPIPLGVKLLDRVFPFGAETHTKHEPYSAAKAEEMRHAGKTVKVVGISYQLGIE